ncbi:unnamed protein product [Urochloa humidicola]
MSRWVESSCGRGVVPRARRDPVGEESGLPLIMCPKCKGARVIERRSRKENVNLGRVYIKCPRDISGMCDYYKWQRQYFEELVDSKVVLVIQNEIDEGDDELEEEREVQSLTRGNGGMVQSQQSKKIEENIDKLLKAVQLLIVLLLSFGGLVVVLFLFK